MPFYYTLNSGVFLKRNTVEMVGVICALVQTSFSRIVAQESEMHTLLLKWLKARPIF